jgi:hypothetical protein
MTLPGHAIFQLDELILAVLMDEPPPDLPDPPAYAYYQVDYDDDSSSL